MKLKTSKQLERHFKGIANHYRIAILLLVSKNEGVTLESITEELHGNIKTISEHTRKLVHAGLLNKSYEGTSVHHVLSPYGRKIVKFLESF